MAVEAGSGRGVGVARFVRSESDPEVAEVAVAVADDRQGQGIGSELLHRLTERARDEGIRRFSGSILEENRPMRELMAELGDVRVTDRAAGAIEVEVELPDEGIGAALRETLRAAARGLLRMRLPRRWSMPQRRSAKSACDRHRRRGGAPPARPGPAG